LIHISTVQALQIEEARALEEWSQAASPLKPDCRLGLGSALCAQLGLAQGF